MAASIDTLVAEFVINEDDSSGNTLAGDVIKKNVQFVEVVESLKHFLISSEVSTRCRSIQLIAAILHKIPFDLLSHDENDHITEFFISKLCDHHSVQPWVIHGLAALTGFTSFSGSRFGQQCCMTIFKEVQNQTMMHADRRATFIVFLNLLTYHLQDIRPLGDSFVCGYIQQMDAEKDPRNLMLAFRCSLLICHHFPLGAMEEEMFEVNSCYFPIDFVIPFNDVHGITRDDLSETLCAVMAATPVFSQYCYPVLLEKLSSDVISAKLDALNTLQACIPVYENKHLQEHLGLLFNLIAREVRAAMSDDIVSSALSTLTIIAKQLSKVTSQLDQFMSDNGLELLRQVESDNDSVRHVSMKMLLAIAGADSNSCRSVSVLLVPSLFTAYRKHCTLESNESFATLVVNFFDMVNDLSVDFADLQLSGNDIQFLLDICHKFVYSQRESFCILGMRGLCSLFGITSGLSLEEMISLAQDASTYHIRENYRDIFSRLFRKQPHLCDEAISSLTSVLHDNLNATFHNKGEHVFSNGADLLTAVAIDTTCGQRVCDVFTQLLDLYQPGNEVNMKKACQCIAQILKTGCTQQRRVISYTLPSMLKFFTSTCRLWPSDKQETHAYLLNDFSSGLQSFVLQDVPMVSEEVLSIVCNVVLAGTDSQQSTMCLLKSDSPWQQLRLVRLMVAVIPWVDVEDHHLVRKMLSSLPDIVLNATDNYSAYQSSRCLAGLLNRMPSGGLVLDDAVQRLDGMITHNLSLPQQHNATVGKRCVLLLTWVAKAFVAKALDLATGFTEQLKALLSDRCLGSTAAEGFATIVASFDDVMCPALGAAVSPVFQQRFFILNLSSLTSELLLAAADVKDNYLSAVLGMLSSIPKQVLESELSALIPLLTHSLCGHSATLQSTALTVLKMGLSNSSQAISMCLSDILPECLNLCCYGVSMGIRILALKCLREMAQLPPVSVMPHRLQVIRCLKRALDDHKRLVRREAAETRSLWFLL